MKIAGMSAVITGGGSGMGAETARQLAQAGAKVALLDINLAAASQVAEAINGIAIECDVTNDSSVEQALLRAKEAHGPARICINCAGIAPGKRIVGREGPMPLADFQQVININLIGSFNVMRIAAAQMTELEALADDERGVIINTASVAAYEGQIGQAAYSASKAGIVGMTLPAARELARFGIRVMTIAPGLIETPMLQNMADKVQEALRAMTVFPKRLGLASEYAQLAMHIIQNSMLNGSVIRMDGAVRLQA
ncbi:MAG: SDR family NAD(P)-dependent oxidoreductase [Gammaproteobacteria bacterium]